MVSIHRALSRPTHPPLYLWWVYKDHCSDHTHSTTFAVRTQWTFVSFIFCSQAPVCRFLPGCLCLSQQNLCLAGWGWGWQLFSLSLQCSAQWVTHLAWLTDVKFFQVRQNVPRVSYISFLDIWMLICMLFIFSCILEFIIIPIFLRSGMKGQGEKGSNQGGGWNYN